MYINESTCTCASTTNTILYIENIKSAWHTKVPNHCMCENFVISS